MPVKKADPDIVKSAEEIFGAKAEPDFDPKEGWAKAGGGGDEELWDFDQNAVLQGVFVDVRRGVGQNNSNLYIMMTPNVGGTPYAFWGSTVIDMRFFNRNEQGHLTDLKIPLGSEIRIEYKGKATSEKSGRSYKDFDIYWRQAPMVKAE